MKEDQILPLKKGKEGFREGARTESIYKREEKLIIIKSGSFLEEGQRATSEWKSGERGENSAGKRRIFTLKKSRDEKRSGEKSCRRGTEAHSGGIFSRNGALGKKGSQKKRTRV